VQRQRSANDQEEKAVTKGDVVDSVAHKTGMTKKDAGEAVEAVLDVITRALQSGDAVVFTGFGKFTSNRRAERMGVNPRTGERVTIKAANVPKFSAGSQLKAAVN
jgi:DNA-binding protein HU-beta